MPVKYVMSKTMYENIKWPEVWSSKARKMVRSKQPLSKKEILDYVNKSFGLRGTVKEIVVMN